MRVLKCKSELNYKTDINANDLMETPPPTSDVNPLRCLISINSHRKNERSHWRESAREGEKKR